LKLSGLPPERVIGSGTILDTARLRYLLSEHLCVDARRVHAFIIGEHGDSEVPLWSPANIAGMKLPKFCAAQQMEYDSKAMDEILRRTRDAAYDIIRRKGTTFYAVAAGIMRLAEAILRNQNTVLSVSSLVRDFYGISEVCLSLPTVVNRSGIAEVLRVRLDAAATDQLRHSADVLKQAIVALRLLD
jgi:L-lactate dehydrogenase